MLRNKEIQNVKKEIENFNRKLKIAQNDLIKTYEFAKPSPTQTELETIDRKEKRYRVMRKQLREMEEKLRALQEGKEPERIKPWTIKRPSNESFLLYFVEA